MIETDMALAIATLQAGRSRTNAGEALAAKKLIGGHVSSAERPLASVAPAPLQADSQAAREGWEFYLHALNAVRSPAVAIDRLGFVLGANAAMNALVDADIRISNRRLLVAHPQSRSRLAALIQSFVGSAAAEVFPTEPIIIFRRNGRQPVITKLLTLPHGVQTALHHDAVAILSFVSIEPKPCPDLFLLMSVFSFTRAEARLAAALADGTSIKDIAKKLSISCETVRHQLKSVFLKTDSHRQSQLTALLARL
jgi:DNA-binding CsgD family transcriptional regulator